MVEERYYGEFMEGYEARQGGFRMNDSLVNKYIGRDRWRYWAFCDGWLKADKRLIRRNGGKGV
jgi:hypothetical protein